MSKQEWIKLGYSNDQSEELSKLETVGTFNIIDGIDIKIEEFMNQYDFDKIIDKFNQMPHIYPITTAELNILTKEKLDKLIKKVKEKPYGEWRTKDGRKYI